MIAIAAVMVFPYLPGSGSEGFKGVSVFVGLLLSLGPATAIGNVIAGVFITYMRPFRIGDRVKIADAVGDILDKDLFGARLRTIKTSTSRCRIPLCCRITSSISPPAPNNGD
ncbi:MAG: mechanosensitive ion channel domain-containing protein [Pseudomonadota bacterium]